MYASEPVLCFDGMWNVRIYGFCQEKSIVMQGTRMLKIKCETEDHIVSKHAKNWSVIQNTKCICTENNITSSWLSHFSKAFERV